MVSAFAARLEQQQLTLPRTSVCAATHSLFIAVNDPPSLRIVPFPVAYGDPGPRTSNSREEGRSSGWDGLGAALKGGGESEAVVLDDWKWLIGHGDGASSFQSATS